jgi:hypothetical protein
MFFLDSPPPVAWNQDDFESLFATGGGESSVIGCGLEQDVERSGLLGGFDGAAARSGP